MKITNNLSPKHNLIGLGIISLVIFGALIWAFQPRANAAQEVKTLQESVEMAQADYDLSQKQAKDALASYCTNWKELATSKRALADATKLDFNLKQEEIDAVNCTNTQLPSTF